MMLSSRTVKPSPFAASVRNNRVVAAPRSSSKSNFQVKLQTPSGTKKLEVEEDVYIIDAAEVAGIDLPYSCRTGACSTCLGLIVEGTVDQSDQSYLDEEQLAEGKVLTCVAYPMSDVTIKTHQDTPEAEEEE